jgi:hypothetical protein
MTNQHRSFDADYALMANCMMYGYVPTEFFRETTPETTTQETVETSQALASLPEAEDQGIDIAWLPIIFALVLGILGISSVAANPRITDSLAVHAQNTVTEIGMPNRWNF